MDSKLARPTLVKKRKIDDDINEFQPIHPATSSTSSMTSIRQSSTARSIGSTTSRTIAKPSHPATSTYSINAQSRQVSRALQTSSKPTTRQSTAEQPISTRLKVLPTSNKSSTSTLSQKRPQWDIKGRLKDLEVSHSQQASLLNASTQKITNLTHTLASSQTENQSTAQLKLKESEKNDQLTARIESLETNLLNQQKDHQIELEATTSKLASSQSISKILQDQQESQIELLIKQKNDLNLELTLTQTEIIKLELCVSRLNLDLQQTKSTIFKKESALESANELITQKDESICKLEDLQSQQQILFQQQELLLKQGELQRKILHNTIQELKGNIRVFCRVRPTSNGDLSCLEINENKITLSKSQDSFNGKIEKITEFSYDKVFGPLSGQSQVFEEISQLVQSALDGYNICCFAYGNTGSGKTFTMEGPDGGRDDLVTMGMIPRAVLQIFSSAEELQVKGWEFEMSAQFIEIYNETLRDLLSREKEKKLEIKHVTGKTIVTEAMNVTVTSSEAVFKLLAQAASNRAIAQTQCNDRSSRSHSVFTLSIKARNLHTGEVIESCLNLVDLAGSERLSNSQSTGDRLKETQSINKSLSALGDVIFAMSNKEGHIPFRNSKNSIGGNSKVLMFVNVSESYADMNESNSL